jgi:hypothetical protein
LASVVAARVEAATKPKQFKRIRDWPYNITYKRKSLNRMIILFAHISGKAPVLRLQLLPHRVRRVVAITENDLQILS